MLDMGFRAVAQQKPSTGRNRSSIQHWPITHLLFLRDCFAMGRSPVTEDSSVCPRYLAFRHYVLTPSIGNGFAAEAGSPRTSEANARAGKACCLSGIRIGRLPPLSGLATRNK